ncbi:hypothetical protein F383_19144 [Gossypium arboreum]|uniref:Uncharacterized protein n=1 Tax=Gossypium arboreum TaxID=29729 RepID=A0A0B0NJX5_GOSAR|nr:hypothetical protein F383_19144 [Gossypium arboreum]
MWYKSVYPLIGTRPRIRATQACVAISNGTRARHTGVWLAV